MVLETISCILIASQEKEVSQPFSQGKRPRQSRPLQSAVPRAGYLSHSALLQGLVDPELGADVSNRGTVTEKFSALVPHTITRQRF